MKKINFLKSFTAMVLWVCFASFHFAWGQGSETFQTQTSLTASYANGSFSGETAGVTINYVHSRNEGLGTADDYSINGKGIMLRRADEPSSVTFVIPNGVGTFSFDARKAFTGGTNNRSLAVYANGDLIYTTPTFGTANADATVHPFSVDVNLSGAVNILITYPSGTPGGNRQITIDNIVWTAFPDVEPEDPPVVTSETFNGTVGQNASFQIQATENPSSFNLVTGTLPDGLTLNTSSGLISGIPTTAGNSSVTISATNDAGTGAAATINLEIAQGTQSVTPDFTNLTKQETDEPFSLPATTDQGITITYNSTNTDVATVAGNTVTIVGTGATTIEAANAGNANYLAFNDSFTLTVTEETGNYNGIGVFQKITSVDDLTDGYYVVTNEANAFAMNNIHNTITSNHYFEHTSVSPEAGQIINPSVNIVWKIETNGGGKTIYNEVIEKYVGWVSGNSASAEDAPANSNRWTFTYVDNKFTVNNVGTPARQLSYNSGSPRFAAYGNNGQHELQLYKLSSAPGEDPSFLVTPTSISGLEYVEGEGPSASQTFEVSGLNMDGSENVTVSVSGTDFEVSLDNTAFSNNVNLNNFDGSATDVYVRLKAGLAINVYSATITVSGYDAEDMTVNLSGEVTEVPGAFALPYSNGLRNADNVAEAEGYGFEFTGTDLQTGAGGYIRMPLNSNIVSPSIDFSLYNGILVSFDATTFGGNSGQQLTVFVSDNNGADYTALDTFNIPAAYETITQAIDVSDLTGLGRIKFEMTGGTNQIRFRDLSMNLGVIWTTNNEWSNGTGPTIDDDVVILGNLTADTDFSANTLMVASTGSLTIESGTAVTVNGKIVNQGGAANFVVENDANLIQELATTSNNIGAITVHRTNQPFKRLDYTIWSSPVQGQQIQAFSPETLPERIYTYEDDNYYVVPDATANFASAKGYLFRAPNDWDDETPVAYSGTFIGVPFSGNLNVSTHANSYTSIGNPYASNIDADLFLGANAGVSTLYFWTNTNPVVDGTYSGNNYATYTLMGGVGTSGPENEESNAPNGFITTGQGFIVASTAGTATFNNSMRTSEAAIFFKTDDTEKHRIWLDLKGEDQGFNQILIGYMEGATNGFDNQIDGVMFRYNGTSLYNLINEGKYTIQGRALPFVDTDVVPLGFKAVEAGNFTISLVGFDGVFDDENVTVYLKDYQANTIHNLSESDYVFQSEAGEFNTRFEVVYENDGSMGVNDLNVNSVQIYTQNQNIIVNANSEKILSVALFDMQGRNLHQNARVNANTYQISTVAKGVLVVRVQTENGKIITKKVILH